MTDNEYDVLKELLDREWVTPMKIGGHDASHHSGTLARLVKKGLVERKERAGWVRRSYLYRVSSAGLLAVQSERERRHGVARFGARNA